MKCVICHGDQVEVKEVREEIFVNNDVVFVSVDIPVCQNCGERYYDRRTMRFLEDIEEKISQHKARLREVGKVMEAEV